MVLGVVGVAWTLWGASGVSGAASGAIRSAGIVIGLVIVFLSARLRRSSPHQTGSGSMFSSPAYRLITALEVLALLGGNVLLNATGNREYIPICVATIVGIHFLAFGRLFATRFYWLGTALIAAASAGAIVGFTAGGSGAIEATSGLIAAASLFAAGGSAILRARASAHT